MLPEYSETRIPWHVNTLSSFLNHLIRVEMLRSQDTPPVETWKLLWSQIWITRFFRPKNRALMDISTIYNSSASCVVSEKSCRFKKLDFELSLSAAFLHQHSAITHHAGIVKSAWVSLFVWRFCPWEQPFGWNHIAWWSKTKSWERQSCRVECLNPFSLRD